MTLEQLIVKHRLDNDKLEILFGSDTNPYTLTVNIDDNSILTLNTNVNWDNVIPDLDLGELRQEVSLILKNVYSILKILYPKPSIKYKSKTCNI